MFIVEKGYCLILSLFNRSSLLRIMTIYGRCVVSLTKFFHTILSSARCIASWRENLVQFSIGSIHLIGEWPLVRLLSTLPVTMSFSTLSAGFLAMCPKYSRLRFKYFDDSRVFTLRSWRIDRCVLFAVFKHPPIAPHLKTMYHTEI